MDRYPNRPFPKRKRGRSALNWIWYWSNSIHERVLLHNYEASGQLRLQRNPEAGSSWPSWPKASQQRAFPGILFT